MAKHKIVRQAYLFGYPLITMDMTHKHETNVRGALTCFITDGGHRGATPDRPPHSRPTW